MALTNKERFTLILPSNSSMNFYPDNTLSDFSTKLANAYDLQDEWSVALSSISYPTSWATISGPVEGSVQYRITSDLDPDELLEKEVEEEFDEVEHGDIEENLIGGKRQPKRAVSPFVIPRLDTANLTPAWPANDPSVYLGTARPSWANVEIPFMSEVAELVEMRYDTPWVRGTDLIPCINGNTRVYAARYRDVEALVDELRNVMGLTPDNEDRRGVIMRYDKRRRRFSVTLKKCTALAFSASLSNILGFNKPLQIHNISREQITVVGDRAPDLRVSYYNMFVQLDILDEQIVGDTLMNLLYVLPMSHEDGEYVQHEVEHLQYVPIKKMYFDEITVRMRRDDGEPVPFEVGKVVLCLDFRKDAPAGL